MPRRRAAAVLGSHPDDAWVTEAEADRGGGHDLERLLGATTVEDAEVEVVEATPESGWERPRLTGIVVASSGGPVWRPDTGVPLPSRLPGPPAELFCLLAAVNPSDRAAVARALSGVNPTVLDRAVRNHRPGTDPLSGRGVGLAIEVLRRREWENAARSLLADPESGVRVAAATALGRVGEEGRSLESLKGLLADPSGDVRVAAVRALAEVATQTGRERVAAFALKPLVYDTDPRVQDAVEGALADLE